MTPMETANIKNRKETERRLIQAVGEIFRTEGYAGIRLNRISRQATINKNLIYRYFGSPQELFKVYIEQQDFWSFYRDHLDEILAANKLDKGRKLAKTILENQLNYFFDNEQMQQLIRWEISEKNPISRGISDMREHIGEQMLQLTDEHFKNSYVNFRVLLALMIAGVYYIVLHTKINGSTFCGIDINNPDDMQKLHSTMQQMIDWAYEKATASKKSA
jgi:AcrR family transcriptional regulator